MTGLSSEKIRWFLSPPGTETYNLDGVLSRNCWLLLGFGDR